MLQQSLFLTMLVFGVFGGQLQYGVSDYMWLGASVCLMLPSLFVLFPVSICSLLCTKQCQCDACMHRCCSANYHVPIRPLRCLPGGNTPGPAEEGEAHHVLLVRSATLRFEDDFNWDKGTATLLTQETIEEAGRG